MNPENPNQDPSQSTFTDPTAPETTANHLTPKKLGIFGAVGLALGGLFAGGVKAGATDHDSHPTEGPAPITGRAPEAPAPVATPAETPAVQVESTPPSMPTMKVEVPAHTTAPKPAATPAPAPPPADQFQLEQGHLMGGPPQPDHTDVVPAPPQDGSTTSTTTVNYEQGGDGSGQTGGTQEQGSGSTATTTTGGDQSTAGSETGPTTPSS